VSFTKTANFCPECGTAVSAASTTVADGESARDPSCLEWEAEMTLLNNRFFLRDATKWLAMTMAVGAALLLPIFGIPGGWGGIQAAMLILLIGLASMTMGTLIFALIMGNRLPMAFKVDAEGVNMKSVSRRMKNINRGAILLGLLARKPGVVGAGMAGRSQEDITIPWNELRKVHLYPAHRVIFLRGDIFSRIRLYCTPSNYALAEQYIRTRLSMRTTVKVF
jgi:hypothetical protein